ncbi:cell division protein FtsQ/DivIB [Fructobacillus ficulneus]|uniref:Cell division protein DivIB n=1 Tax=Fructobacillus ficulneus TaxID=157463 RepID=A0A0K8MHQ2_9LACO|nr:cell division protein FtsQ/DivIB [Fructobacillus ficulneus]GAP00092.1 cell division protein DivIB [Fructobacillus ficulneus]
MQDVGQTILIKTRRSGFLLSMVFLALVAIILVIWQPWQKITAVNVDAGNITTESIEHDSGIKTGIYRYQIFFQESFLQQKLKHNNGKISEVKIKLSGSTVNIEAAEKINAGFIQNNKVWYQLDSAGNQSRVGQPDGQGPVYTGFKQNTQIKRTARAISALDRPIRQSIGEIIFSPDTSNSSRLILMMKDGNTVYASQGSLADKMRYYSGIASQMSDPGVVDLQFGSFSYPYK